MKRIALLMCLVSTISCYSQKKTKEERQAELDKRKITISDTLDYPVKYCLIVAEGKFLSKKVDIHIDYGQDSSFFEDTKIRDKNGKKIEFNSAMDALNYMNSLGWEFVDAYAITIGQQNVYHFLLKSNENTQMDFIPKTKRDFKQKKQ